MTLLPILLRDARGGIIGWSIAMAALTLLIVFSYPAIEGEAEFDELWAEYQDSLGSLFGDCVTLTEFDCYMDTQIVAYLPVVLGIFAVIHASRLLAGEEESGRLDLLLSTPLSRDQVVVGHVLAILVVHTLVAAAVSISMALGALLVGETAEAGPSLLVGFNALPAVWVIGFLTYFMSALFHRRRAPAMIGTVFLVASYFVGGLAPLVPALKPLRWTSITFIYQRSQPLIDGLDALYFAVALPLCALLAVASWWTFSSKDLTG